ncbi:MAG: AraC family transcriptional regulator [Polyangiaceae bacterium]|nr:AraC family transcriptional regulator [Polyangiaceae bacterium]
MEKNIPVRNVYRALGHGTYDRIGAGVLDKSGVAVDEREKRMVAWSLILVLRGRGRYLDQHGNAWNLAPGWCFQRLPNTAHSTYIDPSSNWLEVFVELGPQLHQPLAELGVLPINPPAWSLPPGTHVRSRMLDLVGELAAASERQLPQQVARIIDISVTAMASAEPPARATDPIEEACRLLAEQSSRRLDLAAWCNSRGLDYERFRKEFRNRTGLPPHRYRIRRRIDHACALLRAGRSVQSVAAELGYPSPFEFSAQFRAHLGVPPSRWR